MGADIVPRVFRLVLAAIPKPLDDVVQRYRAAQTFGKNLQDFGLFLSQMDGPLIPAEPKQAPVEVNSDGRGLCVAAATRAFVRSHIATPVSCLSSRRPSQSEPPMRKMARIPSTTAYGCQSHPHSG